MRSIRYALRTMAKSPGFASIAIATMALGIGANTAIFSVVNAVLLRPLPFRDEARVVRVWTTTGDEPHSNHSAGDFLDLKRMNHSFEAFAGFRGELAAASVNGRQPVQLGVQHVTAEFFDVLGIPPALGRPFTGATPTGGERQVVLSDAAWEMLLARDPAAIGRRVRVNGEACTVVAVMPKVAEWPEETGVWLLSQRPVPPSPLDTKDGDPLDSRDSHYFEAVGRLKPGVSLAQAQQDLHGIATRLQHDHPAESGGRDIALVPLREDMTGSVRGALLVIQGAVGLVLLIACANISSLLIARASGRRRELTIRAALGATRLDLVRQLLVESAVLGMAGGVLGLLLSAWLVVLLVGVMPSGIPRAEAIGVDARIMTVTLAASLAASFLFGILPALQASRAESAHVLKQAGDRGSTRTRGRAALVVVEIALTLVLLAGAGLLGNSFIRLQRVDPGFAVDRATVAELMVPQTRYPKGIDQARLYHRLLDGLTARPEFQAVGVGFPGPLKGENASATFYVEGRTSPTRADKPFAHLASVSGGYFAAMGIPMIAGRSFSPRDGADATAVAIVNATLARRYWPGQSPIGKRLRFEDKPGEPWSEVVGLVGDTRQLGLEADAPPLLYLPYEQFVLPFTTVTVRSALPTAAVTSLLKAQLAAIDPDLPFGDINPLAAEVQRSIAEARFRAVLIGVFALLALALAAVGLYGLISYTVAQRTREIGIRVALGAAPRQVLLPTLVEGIRLALAGVGAGLIAALAAGRALASFVFGVGTTDPLTLSAVSVLLLIVAATATYIPSRRALRVDPVDALRGD